MCLRVLCSRIVVVYCTVYCTRTRTRTTDFSCSITVACAAACSATIAPNSGCSCPARCSSRSRARRASRPQRWCARASASAASASTELNSEPRVGARVFYSRDSRALRLNSRTTLLFLQYLQLSTIQIHSFHSTCASPFAVHSARRVDILC